MNAHFEPTAGVVRVYPDGQAYGDRYTFAATVRFIDRETAEILGAMRAPKPSEWRAIVQLMGSYHVREIVFHRVRGTRREKHVVRTSLAKRTER